jgi:hypothetical protein
VIRITSDPALLLRVRGSHFLFTHSLEFHPQSPHITPIDKTMKRSVVIAILFAAAMFGQEPPQELFLYWRVGESGTPWNWKKLSIDPATLKLDTTGNDAMLSAKAPAPAPDPTLAARITALETELATVKAALSAIPAQLPVATQAEAEAGLLGTKLMSPERTLQSFMAWNPIPDFTTASGAFMRNDGGALQWTYKLINPPAGTQPITSAASRITADRLSVRINPNGSYTLGDGSNPVIIDGEDGQYASVCNVNTTLSVTLADEALVPNTNLRLGGSNLTIKPRGCALLQFILPISAWVPVVPVGGPPPPDPLMVALSWDASLAAAGYNVYRKSDGAFAKLNTALIPGTAYTDAPVSGTYTYRATAVDSAGVESVPSNEAVAVVP